MLLLVSVELESEELVLSFLFLTTLLPIELEDFLYRAARLLSTATFLSDRLCFNKADRRQDFLRAKMTFKSLQDTNLFKFGLKRSYHFFQFLDLLEVFNEKDYLIMVFPFGFIMTVNLKFILNGSLGCFGFQFLHHRLIMPTSSKIFLELS